MEKHSLFSVFFIVAMLLTVTFLAGCQDLDVSKLSDEDMQRIADKAIVCEEPYIRFASGCCLDQNGNAICDDDESSGTSGERAADHELDDEINPILDSSQGSNAGKACTDECEVVIDEYGISGPYMFGMDIGKNNPYIYRCAKVGECNKWEFVENCQYGGELFKGKDRTAAQPYKCHDAYENSETYEDGNVHDPVGVSIDIRTFMGEEGGGVIGSANTVEFTLSGAPQDAVWEATDMETIMSYFSFYVGGKELATDSFRLVRYNSGNINNMYDLVTSPDNELATGSPINGKYVLRIFCGENSAAYEYRCIEKRFSYGAFTIQFEKDYLLGRGSFDLALMT